MIPEMKRWICNCLYSTWSGGLREEISLACTWRTWRNDEHRPFFPGWFKADVRPLHNNTWVTTRLSKIWTFEGYLDIWIFGYLDMWTSGYLNMWISGYLDIWISGYLDIWMSGFWSKQWVDASPVRTSVWCSPAGDFFSRKNRSLVFLQPKTALLAFYWDNIQRD